LVCDWLLRLDQIPLSGKLYCATPSHLPHMMCDDLTHHVTALHYNLSPTTSMPPHANPMPTITTITATIHINDHHSLHAYGIMTMMVIHHTCLHPPDLSTMTNATAVIDGGDIPGQQMQSGQQTRTAVSGQLQEGFCIGMYMP